MSKSPSIHPAWSAQAAAWAWAWLGLALALAPALARLFRFDPSIGQDGLLVACWDETFASWGRARVCDQVSFSLSLPPFFSFLFLNLAHIIGTTNHPRSFYPPWIATIPRQTLSLSFFFSFFSSSILSPARLIRPISPSLSPTTPVVVIQYVHRHSLLPNPRKPPGHTVPIAARQQQREREASATKKRKAPSLLASTNKRACDMRPASC